MFYEKDTSQIIDKHCWNVQYQPETSLEKTDQVYCE